MPRIAAYNHGSKKFGGIGGISRKPVPAGEIVYTASWGTGGTFSWVCPEGVTSVSVVCVGAGGRITQNQGYIYSASGGGLGWKNNIPVTPGQTYTVNLAKFGNDYPYLTADADINFTYFISRTTVGARAGSRNYDAETGAPPGGTYFGDGGGNGGAGRPTVYQTSGYAGGAGAGGYTGSGGIGGTTSGIDGTSGTGGGGGGGGGSNTSAAGGGGGVGIYGLGANGAGGTGSTYNGNGGGGGGGSGGGNGTSGDVSTAQGGAGGAYGGAEGSNNGNTSLSGGSALRIIWAGTTGITRAFPSTNVGIL